MDFAVSARVKWLATVHGGGRRTRRIDEYRSRLLVADRTTVARDKDVVSVTLRAPDGSNLPQWHPGAHLDLYLPSGRVRQYSLCGDPSDLGSYQIAVRRIPGGGGGSNEVHDELPIGSVVHVRGPRNAFAFVEPARITRAKRLIFIAGGIGITPILPMVHEADRMGLDWSLIYVGREHGAMPFLDELVQFGSRVMIRTDKDSGPPTASDLLPVDVGGGDAIYCCGPTPMMDLVAERVRHEAGVELHTERFSPRPVVGGRPFRIQLTRTGTVIDVAPDQTALDAVLQVDPTMPYSCRQGFCGTCVAQVIEGEVDHRDDSLSQVNRDAGQMLLCVSRSNSPCLKLDL
ncbi:PDR/VanB family oxidoreductase [Mycolicibacterium mucogenicum]|nr:PDR/VanB family oxidoreductase [Mycolicibacterium mucogenicum]MCX8564422.1 PDR/VanB family oxidoreductase [Mycolicibacterium mucogenicum]